MSYKNPQELVVGLAKLPLAIEAKLPETAPKVSQMMIDASTKGPALPDFPVEIPDLPAVPQLPTLPGVAELRRRIVTKVEVVPPPRPAARGSWAETPVAAAGVVGQGHTVRDYA